MPEQISSIELQSLSPIGLVGCVDIKSRHSFVSDEQRESVCTVAGPLGRIHGSEPYLSSSKKVKAMSRPMPMIRGVIEQSKSDTRVVVSLASIVQSVSVQVGADLPKG